MNLVRCYFCENYTFCCMYRGVENMETYPCPFDAWNLKDPPKKEQKTEKPSYPFCYVARRNKHA